MLTRKIILTVTLLFLLLSFALPVQAATAREGAYGTEPVVSPQDMERMEMMKQTSEMKSGRIGFLQEADKLAGMEVRNSSNERIGTVKDLIINNPQRTVSYVILSSENKLYPVSWSAFDTSKGKFSLNIAKSKLTQAPRIDMIDVSQLGNPEYKQKVDNYYSEQISAVEKKSTLEQATDWMKEKAQQVTGAGEKADLSKLSALKGLTVKNQRGEELGKLRDVLIDVRHGTIAYGTIGFGGLMGVAEKTAVVPWAALAVQPQLGTARLDVDKATLESAALTRSQMQQLTQPQFARQIHDKFGTEPYWEVFGFVPGEEMKLSTAPWLAGSKYNKHFDASKMTTVEGIIKSVGTFEPQKGAEPGLMLKVETKKGESVTVHCGPNRYITQQGFRFKTADTVTITGSKTRIDLKEVIMATQIQMADKTLKLRDQQGTPLWKFEGAQQQQQPQQQQREGQMQETDY